MASSSRPVDLELKKAFKALQIKMVSTKQQLKISDYQSNSLSRVITHASLVKKELNAIPSNVNCYESVGRMYLMKPRQYILDTIDDKIESSKNKIKTIHDSKDYLTKNLKESEKNLRELIATKQKT